MSSQPQNAVQSDAIEELWEEIDRLNRELAKERGRRSELEDTVDDLVEENQRLSHRLEEATATDKNTKIAAIVEYAVNVRENEPVLKLTPKHIKGAAGVSRRYAYDLVDDLPSDYAWAHDPADLTQYGELEIDTDSQSKAVAIDFEGVHGPACPVNKFTTRTSGKGGDE